MPQKGFFQPCFAEAPTFGNFAFQVQMTITQGDEGGIIFRADPVNSKFYLFRISQSGAYDLYLYVDNQGTHAKNLLSNSSTLIKQGQNQTNTITVVDIHCHLFSFRFSVVVIEYLHKPCECTGLASAHRPRNLWWEAGRVKRGHCTSNLCLASRQAGRLHARANTTSVASESISRIPDSLRT